MPLTPEERSEVNRRNAANSTGPKTDEGKAASRRNALKHGLRAEALALPNEDPDAVAARTESWNEYYRPQSPAAHHLVNSCVSATLLSDRCQKYHEAALAWQVREAEYAWDVARDESVAALAGLLRTDPAAAIRRLAQTAHGCRWLIGRWDDLLAALDGRGKWTGPESDEAIRLQGFRPEEDALGECPEAWLTRLLAILCHETPSPVALSRMFRSHQYPDLHRGDYRPDSLPDRDDSRKGLRDMVVDRLEPLRVIEEGLRTEFDDPDRAGAADRALVLHDGPSARLFLRYHSEARNAFHRAYGSLVKTLELDASYVAPNEPNEAPVATPAAAEPAPPNEADSDPLGDANPGDSEVSAGSEGDRSATEIEATPDAARHQAGPAARAEGVTTGSARQVA